MTAGSNSDEKNLVLPTSYEESPKVNKRGGSPETFAGKLASAKDANTPMKKIELRLIAILKRLFSSLTVECLLVCVLSLMKCC